MINLSTLTNTSTGSKENTNIKWINKMDKFQNWFSDYNTEITWFLVGMLFENCINHLARGMFGMALLDVLIAGVNIYFWKTRT